MSGAGVSPRTTVQPSSEQASVGRREAAPRFWNYKARLTPSGFGSRIGLSFRPHCSGCNAPLEARWARTCRYCGGEFGRNVWSRSWYERLVRRVVRWAIYAAIAGFLIWRFAR